MKLLVLLIVAASIAITPSAWGQTPVPAEPVDAPTVVDDGWEFSLSVPIWLVGFDGDLTVRDRELSGDDDDPGDGFLESELNGAFALHLEAEKGRFGLLLDTMYLERTAEGTLDATDAEGTLEGFVGELGAFYTVVEPAPDKRGWGMFRVDALGGLRVSALEIGIEGDAFDGDVSRTFYDPFVGARLELGLIDWLSFKLRGDVGGFGIDAWNTSDLSFNVDSALEFHLARWFDLGVGYRWLNYDLEIGSDSSLDATLSGPYVELKFNF